MTDAYYLLYTLPLVEGQRGRHPVLPALGERMVFVLGRSEDEERQKEDKAFALWDRIQDDARPVWAPDFLRAGLCVAFPRRMLPRVAVAMGIKNPALMKKETGGTGPTQGGKRVLTFDDVWVAPVVVESSQATPVFISKDMENPEWWATVKSLPPSANLPVLVPGGVVMAGGTRRLADVVVEMLREPNGRVLYAPTADKNTWDEFLPQAPEPTQAPEAVPAGGAMVGENGWASVQKFDGNDYRNRRR